MSARGIDFLERWIERNVLPRAAGEDPADEIDGDAQTFIRDIILHVGEPGMPGD